MSTLLCLALIATVLPPQTKMDPSANTLWYKQPAKNWNEALPIGNGRIGGMVFGGVSHETIQLNDDTLWEGAPSDRINPKAKEGLDEVRKLIFAGKNKEASELAGRTMMGVPDRIESYQTLGDLHLKWTGEAMPTNYRRSLNLDEAIARTDFTVNGATLKREVFASAADDVIVVRVRSSKPKSINLSVTLDRPENWATKIVGSQIFMSGQAGKNGVLYDAVAQVSQMEGTQTQFGTELAVSGATEVLIVLTSKANYNAKKFAEPLSVNRVEVCKKKIAAASALGYEKLRSRHVEAHQRWFRRVTLDLGPGRPTLATNERLDAVKKGATDLGLEALYFQFGRYLLMSSSRPGDMAANLQGLWCKDLKAPWNADYHTNINLQMNYWPAEVANLGECHLPLFDYMESIVPSGSKTAKQMYGARGWVVHHLSDVWGFTVPADGVWGIWPVGAAWLALHPWEHYMFTRDHAFLEKRAYPLMKGAAEFLLDFLVEAPTGIPGAGKLVTNPSHSPENAFKKSDGTTSQFTYGSTMDLEIAHGLFTNVLLALDELELKKPGFDAKFRAEVQRALDRLAPLQISSKTGRLQEWIEDYDEPEPGHRHMSHLFGVHPGNQISYLKTPDLAEAAKKSLEYRLSHGGGHTGWSRAWIINFWARFLEPEKAHENVQALLAKSTLPNLLDNHPPFQIDGNFGGTAGIAEMLIQSHEDVLALLPTLPSAWSKGRVTGLCARGGFEVDMQWDKGRLTDAEVRSKGGDDICRIKFPANVKKAELSTGTRTRVMEIEGGYSTFTLDRGKTAKIRVLG